MSTPRSVRWISFFVAWVLLAAVTLSAVSILKRNENKTLLAAKRAKEVALEYVMPHVAIPGLPLYLTGRRVLPVREVEFVHGSKASKHTYVQASGISPETNSAVQFGLTTGALAPGKYRVVVVGAHGPSTSKTIVVESASSVRLDSRCYSEWGTYTITGANGVGLICSNPVGNKWIWEKTQTKPATNPAPAVTVMTSTATPTSATGASSPTTTAATTPTTTAH